MSISSKDVKQFSSDKILKHLDRVQAWLEGKNPYPVTVELDLTNLCNHDCPQCVVSYFRVKNDDTLSTELAKDIIDQLTEAKIRGLIFTGGGEPLCHPDSVEIVKYAGELGNDIGFITNGELINEQNAPVLLDNCRWIRVSLDAGTPETFAQIHGTSKERFHNVVSGLESLVKFKQELNIDCTVGGGFLTSRDTTGEMERTAELCRDLGVDYLQFRPMQFRDENGFDYEVGDVLEQIEDALKYAEKDYDVLFSKHKYEMMKRKDYGRNYGKCCGQQFATVIAASAKMYICCHLRGVEKYCLGDLKNKSFKEIWHSDKRREVISRVKDFKDCIPLCRDNTFNQILWNIKQPKEHKNFL